MNLPVATPAQPRTLVGFSSVALTIQTTENDYRNTCAQADVKLLVPNPGRIIFVKRSGLAADDVQAHNVNACAPCLNPYICVATRGFGTLHSTSPGVEN